MYVSCDKASPNEEGLFIIPGAAVSTCWKLANSKHRILQATTIVMIRDVSDHHLIFRRTIYQCITARYKCVCKRNDL